MVKTISLSKREKELVKQFQLLADEYCRDLKQIDKDSQKESIILMDKDYSKWEKGLNKKDKLIDKNIFKIKSGQGLDSWQIVYKDNHKKRGVASRDFQEKMHAITNVNFDIDLWNVQQTISDINIKDLDRKERNLLKNIQNLDANWYRI